MKQFKDFGIKLDFQGMVGDKIKVDRVLNREIVVMDFKIEESKFEGRGKCLYMQIELNGIKHVMFIGSKRLIELIEMVPKAEFPFKTTIIKENERLEFS